MLRWGVATGAVFVSLAVRAAADVWQVVFEPSSEALVSRPLYMLLYFTLLEALPSAVVTLALGEQVHATSFNRFGSVPWSLRVPRSEVLLGATLGEGSFGVVFAASWRGRAVAVKRLKTAGLGGNEAGALAGAELLRLQDMIECEATLMSRLRHPHVVRLLGLLIEPEHVPSLMTELCPLGSLHTLLFGGGATSLPTTSLGAGHAAPASATTAAAASVPRHGAGLLLLSWRRRLELAQQLVSGVAYLHAQNPPLIHRDLKPHNCLLDAKGALKVADFGLSRLIDSKASGSATHSPPLAAPQADPPDDWTARGRRTTGGAERPTHSSSAPAGIWASIRLTPSVAEQSCSTAKGIEAVEETGPTAPLLAPPAQRAVVENEADLMLTRNCGTAHYAAPEVLQLPGEVGRTAAYTLSADVHSVGMLLWSMASLEPPYAGMRMVAAMRAIRSGERPAPPAGPCPEGWLALVSACWAPDPTSRPSISQCGRVLDGLDAAIEADGVPTAGTHGHILDVLTFRGLGGARFLSGER